MQTLDKYQRPTDSPISRNVGRMAGVEFDRSFNVQTRRIKTSTLAVQNFIQESDTDTASVAAITTGQSVLATFTLSPDNRNSNAKNFGIPQISVYQGTATTSAFQIYPRSGGSITPSSYIFDFGFDWASASSDGSDVVAMLALENVSAGTVALLFKVKWKYIASRDGSFTPAVS